MAIPSPARDLEPSLRQNSTSGPGQGLLTAVLAWIGTDSELKLLHGKDFRTCTVPYESNKR